jgi:hypothetical protein
MADFLQKFDHFQQAMNYFTTIEEAEWFWSKKVETLLFECIQKAKGDEKKHAAATIESWKIILIDLDDNCEKIGETVFDSKTSSKTVELLKLNAFHGLKL